MLLNVLCTFYYSEVLQSRAKLIEDTDTMRRQNAELRILMHQYVKSQASHSLTAVVLITFNYILLIKRPTAKKRE